MISNTSKKSLLACSAIALAAHSAWAGRPLSVDDANVNDKGAGHVEVWTAREVGPSRTTTIAPAYGLLDCLEVAAVFSRDRTASETLRGASAKWRITASQEQGCNMAASLALAKASGGAGRSTVLNGVLSCNGLASASVHLNLGAVKATDVSTKATWGIAIEREFGQFTPHAEWFGVEGIKPVFQIGARTQLCKMVQIDGTVGRSQGESLYSLGFKFQF